MPLRVVSSASTPNLSGAGATAVTMPAGLVAKRLLVMFAICSGSAGFSVPGWTLGPFSADFGNGGFLAALTKIATGSDTGSITPNDGAAHNRGAQVYQIDGWTGTEANVTGTAGNPGNTASGTIDSPSITSTFRRDNLWFTCGAGVGTTAQTAPTNYTNATTTLWGASTSTLVVARRQLIAVTEDPGAFGGGSLTFRTWLTLCVPNGPTDFMPFFA